MARPRLLGFLGDIQVSGLGNFWNLDQHDIPASPGVYILFARSGIDFPYPNGKSPVYYVGMAARLRNRLLADVAYAREAAFDRLWDVYLRRYEYAAKFGGRYALRRGGRVPYEPEFPEELEVYTAFLKRMASIAEYPSDARADPRQHMGILRPPGLVVPFTRHRN